MTPSSTTPTPSGLCHLVVMMTLFCVAGCQPAQQADEPVAEPDAEQEMSAPPDSLALSWTIDTNEGTYGMPESIIYLNAGGLRFPVASGPGMQEMTPEQRERFRAPRGALAAAGYWAGLGVNVHITQENGMIRIRQAIWDEAVGAEAAYDYMEVAVISAADIVAAKDQPSSGPTWSGCFEGKHEVTTSTYDIIVDNRQVTADVQLVIADDRNGYYTSAGIAGGGQQIGSSLFVEQFITIEDDHQNNVEIWHVDNPANPKILIIDDREYRRCSPEQTPGT